MNEGEIVAQNSFEHSNITSNLCIGSLLVETQKRFFNVGSIRCVSTNGRICDQCRSYDPKREEEGQMFRVEPLPIAARRLADNSTIAHKLPRFLLPNGLPR